MYPYKYPHTITNANETLTFEKVIREGSEDKMIVSNRIKPKHGPPFHVHFKQEESLTVKTGRLAYQILGNEPQIITEGQTVLFQRNQMHRFWNPDDDILECTGWIKPANSIDYFLNGIYTSMNKSGTPQGDPFDSAYLITRYKSEYDIAEIPSFVKRVIMPITVFIGKILGKYDHFKDAPEPIK